MLIKQGIFINQGIFVKQGISIKQGFSLMSFGWMKFPSKSYIYGLIPPNHSTYLEFGSKTVLKYENSKIFVTILQDSNKRQLHKTFLIFSRLIWSLQEAKHKVQSLQNWIPRQRVCDKYWKRRLLTENKI